jgi:enhancing lycopene biosynthesis protein 2
MARIGVCLSGCGVFDGAEIHEAVCTLLALDQAGAEYVCMAPNIEQYDVVDHTLQTPIPGKTRNVLMESARIARGEILDLVKVRSHDIDALIFPGGFGAAKNLCTLAIDGVECAVNPEVERLVGEMIDAGKPIGAICIAPAMLARVLTRHGLAPRVTVGNDPQTAEGIRAMGGEHVECPADQIVVDEELKVVTTPAYMLASGPAEVYAGVKKLVEKIIELTGK